MKSQLTALLLSIQIGLPASHAAAQPEVYRAGPSPAAACAARLADQPGASPGLLRLCDRGVRQSDLTEAGRAAALANAGTVRLRLGDHEGAVRRLASAHVSGKAPADIVISLSAALIRLERHDEAAILLSDLNPVSPALRVKALYNRATAEMNLGRVEAAYVDLREAVSLDPDFKPASDLLAHFKVNSAKVAPAAETRHAETAQPGVISTTR